MANQDAINQLRQNNWRLLKGQVAVNNDIADMDIRQAKRMGELARLGAQTATKLMSQYDQIRTKNLESEAYNDFYQNLYPDYGNTEDAANASNTLMASQNSSAELHSQLGVARTKGLPGNIVSKIAEKHPVYGYTYAKLHLNKLGGRFSSYMNSAMVKDETELTLPDVINPTTGLPHTFQIKNAKSLDEKMAAHRYLRGKYFTDNNIGAFGTAFLALPGERGGSDFFGTISAAENGKNGMFNKYAKEADIWETQQRIAMMGEAFAAKPDAITWQNFLDANMIGKDQNGNLITPEKALKNTDTFTFALIKAGQLDDEGIQNIADSIAPGTIQKTQNKKGTLTPIIEDGVIVGYGQTRAQKWPTRFSYKDGNFGTYMNTWSKAKLNKHENLKKLKKLDFKKEFKDAQIAIKRAATTTEAWKVLGDLRREYGSGEDFDYKPLVTLIREGALTWQDVPEEVNALLKRIDANLPITLSNIEPSKAALTHPTIAEYYNAEQERWEEDNVKEQLEVVKALLPNYQHHLITGKTTWKPGTGTADEENLQRTLMSHYWHILQTENTTPVEAAARTKEFLIENGGGAGHLKLTNEQIAAAIVETGKGPIGEGGIEVKSNRFSLDNQGNLVNKKLGLHYDYEKPKEIDQLKVIKDALGKDPIKTLSEIGADGEPKYKLFEGETKETSDYNKILWETREVPDALIDHAEAIEKPLTEVINARLAAWGHPPLDEDVEELMGAPLVKYLTGGIQNALFGQVDHGIYKPYEISNYVAKRADSPTALLDTYGLETFHIGADEFGVPDEEKCAAYCFFATHFGDEAIGDLNDNLSTTTFSDAFWDKYMNDPEWRDLVRSDIDFQWQEYRFGYGDAPLLPTLQK